MWAALTALVGAVGDDPAAAEFVEAAAEFLIAAQVNERGTGRLDQLGLPLHLEL